MSNQPFSFPPPPPPPPRRTSDSSHQQNNGFPSGRGAYRGGGNSYRGQGRGGRGGIYSGHQPAGYLNASHGYGQNSSNRPYNNNTLQRNSHTNSSQKRNHATAFAQPNNPRSRPIAPPAVPSFNASIAHLLPVKAAITPDATPTSISAPDEAAKKTSAQPKKNLLGLTPSHPDDSSSDDEDEEVRLSETLNSASSAGGQGLSFTYRGEISSLRTAKEIQAWVAERKKRFPTVAMAEAAKKEREENRRKLQEEKAEKKRKYEEDKAERKRKAEDARKARELAQHMLAVEREARNRKQTMSITKGQDKKGQNSKDGDAAARAEAKAEKLRKRALKAEQALKKAEEALRFLKEKQATALTQQDPTVKDDVESSSDSEASEASVSKPVLDPDETSSSGSDSDTSSNSSSSSLSDSESNEDSDTSVAPTTISTKDPSLMLNSFPPTPSQGPKPPKQLRVCRNLLKSNRCSYGSRCRYSHDLSAYGKGKQDTISKKRRLDSAAVLAKPQRRKGLFQVMVEKEEEEKRRTVARAIIALGESGFLDDPTGTGTT